MNTDQIRRGEEAKKLLDHPLLKEYRAELEKARIEKIAACNPGDVEKIQELLRQKNVEFTWITFLEREYNRSLRELAKTEEKK